VGRAHEHDPRHADRDDQRLDSADRAADIFRGIRIDPLAPGNTGYLLWLILGFLSRWPCCSSASAAGRHLRPRAHVQPRLRRLHALLDPALAHMDARQRGGALADRDARGPGRRRRAPVRELVRNPHGRFPAHQRGLALGVNSIAAIAGSFLGLVLGGLLGPVAWRLVFLVSVPIGVFATIWAYGPCGSSASAGRRGSTGGATSPSPSVSSA
jgi:hypothetical protein